MTAYLGYKNLIPEGTITANDSPGFEKENAYDWFTYTWWRDPGNLLVCYYQIDFEELQTFNYWACAAHNIDTLEPPEGNRPNIRLQGWNETGENWESIGALVQVENNAPIFFKTTNPITIYKRFRFMIAWYTQQAAPLIGAFSMGEALELPEGMRPSFTPPPAAVNDDIFNSESATGQFLGRSVERFGYQINIKQDQLNPEWVRDNWYEIASMLGEQPFFYCWNYEEYPEDAVYAWLDGDMPIPKYTNPVHMEFLIKARCSHLVRWF